ncbi:MAG: ferrochelatase [Rhodospirillaceae bacterium]
MDERLAIVVFSLGGPDSPEAVRPFLFNLFNDRYIIPWIQPFRWLLARTISGARAKKSRGYYARLGGRSVLLPETTAQAKALESAAAHYAKDVRAFVYMRYWHPMAPEVVAQLKEYAPTRIVVVPMYPQYSTTTTGTSVDALTKEARKQGLTTPFEVICCFPTAAGFIAPMVSMIGKTYAEMAAQGQKPRLLLTAHGLPEKTIASGDPYQWQVEQTAAAVVAGLNIEGLDWAICYQSRVGPAKWIGPSTETEIQRAGKDGVPLIVAPISFVSEHVETLVELDETMRDLAAESGVPAYRRIPAVRTDATFVATLAGFIGFLKGRKTPCSDTGAKLCPAKFGACPHS